jgi:hypothetical protein
MKTMLLLVGIIAANGLLAQPTLTFQFSDDLLQSAPIFNAGDAVDPGSSGENQVWDFSNGSFPLVQMTTFDVPANTPFALAYPNSDLVLIAEDAGGTNYIFYNFESDGVYTVGLETIGFVSQVYSNPRRDLSSPMQYEDSYTDMAEYTTESFGFETVGVSEYELEVDGYGTLITPYATYQNALRIHMVETTELTIDPGKIEPFVIEVILDSHGWVIDGYPIPIFLTFEQSVDGVPEGGNARYLSGISLDTEDFNTLIGVSLYPVPAVDFVNLDIGDNQTGAATVRIFDVRGKLIKEFTRGMAKVTRFDISDLRSGFYSINIQTEEGMATKHFTK